MTIKTKTSCGRGGMVDTRDLKSLAGNRRASSSLAVRTTRGARSTRNESVLQDSYGRQVTYLRVSVTDRCDLRCVYCMKERMVFLPKQDVLTFEELERLCALFIRMGVRKLRITGGEPLVRRGILDFLRRLSLYRDVELVMTTNGTRLYDYAEALAACGIKRLNVSLDTLDEDVFRQVTRGGDVHRVLAGMAAAAGVGIKIKVNVVALRGINDTALTQMVYWCAERGYDMTMIEVMPMGEMPMCREQQFVSLQEVQACMRATLPMQAVAGGCSSGPARRYFVPSLGIHLGFITPLSAHFCEGCNRVRLTCTGSLYTCLGREGSMDLRALLRAGADDAALCSAVHEAMAAKPRGHDFAASMGVRAGAVARHMSVTGG